jgi:FkbM family methyltransferase
MREARSVQHLVVMKMAATRLVRRTRLSRPFNLISTSAARAVQRSLGLRSDRLVRYLPRVGRVESKLPNGRCLRLWTLGDDRIPNYIYWRGWQGHEPETIRLFFSIAQQSRTTIDIGAYVGLYALVAGLANPIGRVFAFEPAPEVFARLAINVSLNNLKNVRCVQSAVGREVGSARLLMPPRHFPTSSTLSPDFALRKSDQPVPIEVAVTSLDRFCEDNDLASVDLVKIDTEGTEVDVLKGMRGVIERYCPTIICEVLEGSPTRPIIELLSPYGYTSYSLGRDGPVPGWPGQVQPRGRNYLFTVMHSAKLDGMVTGS